MGQSLCEGAESLPIVTPADTGWGNYAFRRGVRTWSYGDHMSDPERRRDEQFALAPLTAAISGGLGETIANGFADHLKATLAPARKDGPPHFLVAYAGQGGRQIDELSSTDHATDPRTPEVKKRGGGYYKTSLDDARRAVKQAKIAGESFTIGALVWMQGEANGGPRGGIMPSRWDDELLPPAGQEWYRDRLIAYRRQWSDDLRAITGQSGEIPMFTYQTLGPAGAAQLMAADHEPHLFMVGPHYMVPSAINSHRDNGTYGAAIHLSADGERWYGEQVGKVVRRVVVEGEDWQPLRPREAWLDASRTSVLIEFAVPRPPLVLDHTFFPREQSEMRDGFSSLSGFQIRTSTGASVSLTAVEVEAPTRVRIRLAVPLPADIKCTARYGLPFSGALGTIVSLRAGATVGGQETTEMLIAGDLSERLQPLLDEGAFYVTNSSAGASYAQAIIRSVHREGEATVLRFENRELRNAVPFVAGQTLSALRPFSYGNLRDSDAEAAIYRFTDRAYGRRAGQAYPLWNWCVVFEDFAVGTR